jgi:hypothetical protein
MAPPTATETQTTTVTPQAPKSAQEDGVNKAKVKMSGFPQAPVFEDKYQEREYLKGRLAAAFRIFGKNGYDEGSFFLALSIYKTCRTKGRGNLFTNKASTGVAGHITLRDPVDPTTFWVNPFGLAFSLIKASDLIQVDHAGKVIDGGPTRLLNAAAFMIHSAIHSARPDVLCAAHSHSLYGRAFCTLGRPLDIITQDSCAFYKVFWLLSFFRPVMMSKYT